MMHLRSLVIFTVILPSAARHGPTIHFKNLNVGKPTSTASRLLALRGGGYPVAIDNEVGPLPKDDAQASEGADKQANKQPLKRTGKLSKIASALARLRGGQGRAPGPPATSLKSAASVIPHPDKAGRSYELPPSCGGEDAYFVNDTAGVVGVADGVGGWSLQGVDPGVFSRQLMQSAAESVRSGESDPGAVLQSAHANTTSLGSSTALVVTLVPAEGGTTAKLWAANLGDSGFMVLRSGAVLSQSRPQQHRFNTPFQLSAPKMGLGGDMPRDAETYEVNDVRAGDVLVLGSDGLFDNIFPEEVAAIVSSAQSDESLSANPQALAEHIANRLARKAADLGKDSNRMSPFAVEAASAGLPFRGGKQDDVTVVVSVLS